jgi:DNA-binding transcriptional LysR family regulator
MDITTLELFVEVMRRRNFTDIARTHGVAPSSVSRTITGLEKELGIRLFQRTTRKLEPTEAGMAYLERISSVLDDLESARQIATDLSEEPRGTLRVTASTVFGEMQIVPLLPELAEKYPALSVELNLTDAYLDLVDERIDIAIRLGTLRDSTYIAKRLTKMKFYVCASPEYIKKQGQPSLPEQVAEHNCLLFPRSGFTLNWLFKSKDQVTVNIPIQGNCLITNSRAIKQCTLYGMGLSLLPDWLVKEEIADGTLLDLFPDHEVSATDFDSSVWIVYPSKEYLALKSRVFIDSLYARFSPIDKTGK